MNQEVVNIKDLKVSTYTIPTDGPESDGTIKWNSTTMVLVQAEAGGKKGLDILMPMFLPHSSSTKV